MKGKLYEKESDYILFTGNKWHVECAISGYAGTSCNCGNKYIRYNNRSNITSSNKDVLNISFSNNEENIRQVQIVNTMGTIMLDKANLTNNVIDINSISSGLYIVKIITNKGNVYFEKVVIEH